jgi:hypothetical protein
LWLLPVAIGLLGGCVEKLATPGGCPDLCPGDPIIVRDTVITATPDGDTTFFGYLPRSARTVLLVSSGLPAVEARAFVVFPALKLDSVTVDGAPAAFTFDTIAVGFNIAIRDSTATGLVLYIHRIPVTTDTTISFAALDGLLGPTSIIDSIVVPDSVQRGRVETLIAGEGLALLDAAWARGSRPWPEDIRGSRNR